MRDIRAITFASSLKALMSDYSQIVSSYLGTHQIGLNRVYNLLLAEEQVQHHNALEDALMLRYVAENLKDKILCFVM